MATRWSNRLNLNMFRSARWSLTLFYLGVLVLFNLAVSLSIRVYAEHVFLLSAITQQDQVERWAEGAHYSYSSLDTIERDDAAAVRQELNNGLLVINLLALGIGGVLSYWFAGRALQPLQQAHETQARFTADASHEMRTPLANIRLENEIFLRQKSFGEKDARDQLASNLEEVQRLERLSNNLLLLHQFGQDALKREPVAVKAVVDEAMHQLSATIATRKVAVTVNLIPATVIGHYDSLVQLVCILLDNGLKYGGQGGALTINGHKRAKRYLLAIEDKGPGIAAADLPYIFDRLYRGDKARSARVTGYGLGLALAKEIVRANGGTITARNLATGGACFELHLELSQRQ